MSLITLRSSAQDNGANVFESAAVWTNHFKKGIRLHPGNTLELVSMSINKIDKFEIIQGQNDVFLWRIGSGPATLGAAPVFQQHEITIPPGSYNGLELASTVASLCNKSTFIDLFKGGWTMTFTQPTSDATGTFTLNYGQKETPALNFNESTIENINNPTTDGAVPTFTDQPATGSKVIVFPASSGSMDGIATATHLFQGSRGIFGNGGSLSANLAPFRVLGAVDLAGGLRNFNSFNGDGVNYTGVATALVPTLVGYNYQVDVAAGEAGAIGGNVLGAAGILKTDGSSAGAVVSGGTGYVVGDTGVFSGGSGSGATFSVTAVGAGGAVTDYNITGGGFGYTATDVLTCAGAGGGDATVQIIAVNDAATGTGYAVGDIGTFVTVHGSAPTTDAKYRVTTVNAGAVTGVAILDNFKGVGYAVLDVLRLDGNGNGEAYIQVGAVQGGNEPYFGAADEQGIFGMVSSNGKVWYDLTAANPWANSYGAGSTDNFDTTGAEAGGYTFGRNKSAGTPRVYWLQDPSQSGRFFEYNNPPVPGPATLLDTFDLIQPGIFLSQTYGSTVTSASWVGGTVPDLRTNLAQASPETATLKYRYNAATNVFDWDGGFVDIPRTITHPGGAFTPVYKQNYGRTGIGWVRNDLVTGRTKYPGDPNATFSLNTAECDMVFDLRSNLSSTDIEVDLFQMNNTGTANYPAPGWRTGKTVFSTRPGDWNTDLPNSAPAPANWTDFTYGTDHIQMKISVTNLRTIAVIISHDTGGNGTFKEEVELINSGQQGMAGESLTRNIREVFYPLRPILRLSRGSSFDGRTIRVIGSMDTQDITQTDAVLRSETGGAVETWQDAPDGADPPNATTLPALFKFGSISPDQVVDANPTENQILTRDLPPNTGSVQDVFGFENVYSYAAGNATNPTSTESSRVPHTQILEPSLHVELPDFNIQSWSGESGDSTKSIAVIPREQWTTDSQKGSLHWQSQYPQPVDLNLTETRMLYTLTARIREPSGELVKDLINPTELTLRIGQTDESRQQRVMDKAMERLAGAISNRQDQRISDIGAGMPKI